MGGFLGVSLVFTIALFFASQSLHNDKVKNADPRVSMSGWKIRICHKNT